MLVLQMRCAASSCSGRAAVALTTLRRGSHTTQSKRLHGVSFAGAAKTFQLRVSKTLASRARAALRRSLVLTVRDSGTSARTVVLTLARPR
jgi:hypothetical protein